VKDSRRRVASSTPLVEARGSPGGRTPLTLDLVIRLGTRGVTSAQVSSTATSLARAGWRIAAIVSTHSLSLFGMRRPTDFQILPVLDGQCRPGFKPVIHLAHPAGDAGRSVLSAGPGEPPSTTAANA
jgi:hypothetical protein